MNAALLRLPSARRWLPFVGLRSPAASRHLRLLIRCPQGAAPAPAERAAPSWVLVDLSLPDGSPPLAQGQDTERLAPLSRQHAAVLVLGSEAASHFHLPAPKGLRRREWPTLVEEHVCGEAEVLELAALAQGRDHLELVAMNRALLLGWQAWLADRGVRVSHWAVTFMGLPPPPDSDSLSVLADERQLSIKVLGEPPTPHAPMTEQWLSWPCEWRSHLPAALRERHWHMPLGEHDASDEIARLAFYARHLPATLPRLPMPAGASPPPFLRLTGLPRTTRRLALALLVLALTHTGLSGWQGYLDRRDSIATSQVRLASLFGDEVGGLSAMAASARLDERQRALDALQTRNRHVSEALARTTQRLDAPLTLAGMEVAGQRLTLAWTLTETADTDGTSLAEALTDLGRSAWQPASRRLTLTLDLAALHTAGDAP